MSEEMELPKTIWISPRDSECTWASADDPRLADEFDELGWVRYARVDDPVRAVEVNQSQPV